MTTWLEPESIEVPAALREAVGGHPLVAETLARRGIVTAAAARAFLDPAAYTPADPHDLPDMALAVERLRRAIAYGERIAIWGDFDADGQTATALLLESLRALGADVVFRVPTRQEGHGLHEAGLARLIEEGARLILTCDTGVTAHAAVARANRLGAGVIITDHHVPLSDAGGGPGHHLPPALATINPHRLPPGHPMATLPGVGVAYELVRALDPGVAGHALDLVAVGTVADVATLTGDARYQVQRGLEALRRTGRPGLQAVYQAAGLRPEGITEEHISFLLGPRLNALGRLDDAAKGVDLLTTGDWTRARTLATEVEGLNGRRQWLTKQVTDAALGQIEREPALLRDFAALVLSHAEWPPGVTGIVAGRLAERFDKPAMLISTPEAKLARGSGRSVPGLDLIAALTDCAPLLESFGGHKGAAGCSLEPERIPELRAALSRAVAARAEAIPEPVLPIDAYVELSDISLELVSEINRLAPFGPGNPSLTLVVHDLRILSQATIGRTEEHRRLTVEDAQDRSQTVFWWQGAAWPLPRGRFDLAFTLRASDYRGAAEVQVEWLGARELEPVEVEVEEVPAIEVRDYRALSNPDDALRALAAAGDLQVWAEGDRLPGVESLTRQQLAPGPRLVVWTAPPGPRQLRAALERVQPEEVYLFGRDPGLDGADAFLERLGGMAKYALRAREGLLNLEAAAAATAQVPSAVRAGLEWLAAQGQLLILERGDEAWRLAPGEGRTDPQATALARTRLEALLAEAAAYRDYLRSAPAAALLRS